MKTSARRKFLSVGLVMAAGAVLPGRALRAQAELPAGAVLQTFIGKAHHAESGVWLYTEQHRHVYQGGRWLSGLIRYVAPQGTLLGEKTLDFSQDRYVPIMRTVYAPLGEEEAITRIDDAVVIMETVKGGQRKVREIPRSASLAVDSGFHAFVQAQLDELKAGRTVNLRLGVINQFDQFRFRIRRSDERIAPDATQISLIVEADSMLRMLVPAIRLVYDTRTRDMLEYEGLSNIVDPQTRKAPQVRIRYEYGPA